MSPKKHKYTIEIADFMSDFGWHRPEFFVHHCDHRFLSSSGDMVMEPLRNTTANFFDGSQEGTRFRLTVTKRCLGSDIIVDTRRPHWKKKVSAWVTTIAFRRMAEADRKAAEMHQHNLHLQKTDEFLRPYADRAGIPVEDLHKVFDIHLHWDHVNPTDGPNAVRLSGLGQLGLLMNNVSALNLHDLLTRAATFVAAMKTSGFFKCFKP